MQQVKDILNATLFGLPELAPLIPDLDLDVQAGRIGFKLKPNVVAAMEETILRLNATVSIPFKFVVLSL